MRYQKRSKYGNKKVFRYGRWFDSIAEAEYYPIAVSYADQYGYELKLNQWAIKKTQYVADYAFYHRGKLVRLVDVKGVETKDFKLKAKMIARELGLVIVLAKKKRGGFVEYPFNMPASKRKEVL